MDWLLIVIILALVGTLGSLMLGLLSMSGGGSTDRHFSTPLMWTRVAFQGVAVLLLIAAVVLR